jgi:hypothetical protein
MLFSASAFFTLREFTSRPCGQALCRYEGSARNFEKPFSAHGFMTFSTS